MKKYIITASMAITLASCLQASTLEEQVSANTLSIGLNSTSIETISNVLNSLEKRIITLETKVTTLEGFHNIREFTIHGTNEKDITYEGLQIGLSSLNYQNNEFLYIKAEGSNGVSEFCTSNSKAKELLDAYIEGNTYTWWGYNYANTWSILRLRGESSWSPSYRINAASAIHTLYNNFSLTISNSSSNSSEIHIKPNELTNDVFANGSDTYSNNSVIFRVAPTRMQACGF